MKVSELIESLEKFDKDLDVCVAICREKGKSYGTVASAHIENIMGLKAVVQLDATEGVECHTKTTSDYQNPSRQGHGFKLD